MRVSSFLVVVGLLVACATLASCARFRDEGELQPYDPLGRTVPPPAHRTSTDEHGRRYVDASIFDAFVGASDADRGP